MKTKKVILLTTLLTLVLVMSSCNNTNNDEDENNSDIKEKLRAFNECLAENGVVIYGYDWCPACRNLVEQLGGKEIAEPVYVDCIANQERCIEETQTDYVPEVQIYGELYEGIRNLYAFSEITGCMLPQ